MPLIVMGQLFTFSEDFGPWNETNFFIYQLVAYQLGSVFGLIRSYPGQLRQEKFWQTLPALIIAPFKRIYLLLGIYVSHLMLISVPFTLFFVFSYIYLPISILTIFSMLFVYFCISLIFAGIGLIIGIGAISKENFVGILKFGIGILFAFSCIALPFEFFPEYLQNFIAMNPFFYIINFPRLVWIENNFIYSILTHPVHLFLLISGAILTPMFGLFVFNYIFKKYGIVGY